MSDRIRVKVASPDVPRHSRGDAADDGDSHERERAAMTQAEEFTPEAGARSPAQRRLLLQSYQAIEKRDWWIWGNTVLIMLLLTAAISFLVLPSLASDTRTFFHISLKDAVIVLVLLVVFFNIYTIYQQVLIKR